VCLNANEELGYCGAYGFNLGGWQGGQAEYMLEPWADAQNRAATPIVRGLSRTKAIASVASILPPSNPLPSA
jgi:glutathione-independent formaldehyde dehydrogenase